MVLFQGHYVERGCVMLVHPKYDSMFTHYLYNMNGEEKLETNEYGIMAPYEDKEVVAGNLVVTRKYFVAVIDGEHLATEKGIQELSDTLFHELAHAWLYLTNRTQKPRYDELFQW